VEVESPMLNALASTVLLAEKRLTWGPERLKKLDKEKLRQARLDSMCGMEQLEDLMTSMVIGDQRTYAF